MIEEKRNELVERVLAESKDFIFDDKKFEDFRNIINTLISDYDINTRETGLIPSDSFIPPYYNVYIAHKKIAGRSTGTLKLYHSILMDFFLYKPAPLEQMDSTLMLRYLYDYQKRKGISNRTLDSIRIIILGFVNWAVNEGHLKKNFVGNIERIKFTVKPREPLTDEEVAIFKNSCQTFREQALVDLFLSTGCRISEVVNMKWSDIDLENRSILVFGKGSKYRTVFFNSEAKISLLQYKMANNKESINVFIKDRYPYTGLSKETISKTIRNISTRANLNKPVTAHVLRHTFATSALAKGMTIEQVRQLLGHEDVRTTLIYAKTDMSKLNGDYKRCFS